MNDNILINHTKIKIDFVICLYFYYFITIIAEILNLCKYLIIKKTYKIVVLRTAQEIWKTKSFGQKITFNWNILHRKTFVRYI